MAKRKATKKKKTTKKTPKSNKTTKKTTKRTTKKTTVKKKAAKKASKKAAKKSTVKKPTSKKITMKLGPISKPLVNIGDQVPEFELPATGNQSVRLSDLKNKKVVLYFYPKDSTPGCTIEGHDFSRLKQEFESKNTVVFGISRDSLKSHENFKAKQNYTIDLISDSEEKLCKTFGVIKIKNMYGKMVQGLDRSTFVIDESGRLVKEWRGVKVENHAEEVLNFVRSLDS